MIEIAIVEDEQKYRDVLIDFVKKFEQEEKTECKVSSFKNGMEFLGDYQPIYDVVFMDIEMPMMNGMEIANHLRKIDSQVPLIFVTKMAQFAINGYEVNALDFIVKPVSYYNFSIKLKKAIALKGKNKKALIVLQQGDLIERVDVNDIFYLEVSDHQLIYHIKGSTFSMRGSLAEREKGLSCYHFVRCNNCYLVNMSKILKVKGNNILIENGDEIIISRTYRKKFLDCFSDFLGENS